MSEHPILFSGPMVRAILEGDKTQTRRIVKPHPPASAPARIGTHDLDPDMGGGYGFFDDEDGLYRCPYGQPGDVLWVRETHWRLRDGSKSPVWYCADGEPPNTDERFHRKFPSIHMPRWACRLLLDVTEVRVERLQEISYADVISEGLTRWLTDEQQTDSAHRAAARKDFACLWDEINGKRAPWDSNPFVWVVSFRRQESTP